MILVLGGTIDSRHLYEKLKNENKSFMFTTATEYGKSLIDLNDKKILSERLSKEELLHLIKEEKIRVVIDTTHPYAYIISKNAMEACEEMKINYVRFERKKEDINKFENIIIKAKDYKDAAKKASKLEGNIILTTGSKTLDIFVEEINLQRIYPRVLPTSSMIKRCEDLGFKPYQIIGMQGPFSTEMNKDLIDKYEIKVLVTKDSGKVGGLMEKLQAAYEKNVKVIFIDRPNLKYKNLYDNMELLLKKVGEMIE